MREFSNHAVWWMSDSTMAVSSKYTQDLSIQIVFFTFSCKWFLCFYFWAFIWSYIVDLFAALHELTSASAYTLLKLASSVRALLKPYGDTLTGMYIHVMALKIPGFKGQTGTSVQQLTRSHSRDIISSLIRNRYSRTTS